jgi:hypothetical protein
MMGQALLELVLKSYTLLQSALPSLPSSDVDWLPSNYSFPEDLLADLTEPERQRLRQKLDLMSATTFPAFVSRCRSENEGFAAKMSNLSSGLDLGGGSPFLKLSFFSG